ncbi:MAG: hypothetical protein J1F43_09015 [Muribaculaceae bacterium]|nr:hypothetical protein [Muribaculaceae bacterium]
MKFLTYISDRVKQRMPKVLYLPALCITILGMVSSCTDDLSVDRGILEEDFTGITLYLPDVDAAAEFGATRSDEFANTRAYDIARETNFNTLYIVAIGFNNGTEGVMHTFYKSQPDSYDAATGYRKYNIGLSPGDYRIYVVANLNRYTYKGDAHSTFPQAIANEDDIRNLIIRFNASTPLEPGFLPMACLNENLMVGQERSSANQVGKDGFVKIDETRGGQKVYADLKYLCAKVRYTILFDRKFTSFLENDVIDVHRDASNYDEKPFANRIRQSTAIGDGNISERDKDYISESDGDQSFYSSWPISLDRYIFPEHTNDGSELDNIYNLDPETETGAEKIKEALDKMRPWTTADGDWATSDKFKQHRAWQGIAYLPENLIENIETESDLLSVLNFPYTFNNHSGEESPRKIKLDFDNGNGKRGLQRSMSYDVYALIKTPDPADMVVNVLVEPWDLQSLTYQLHGPYELIVESSYIDHLSLEDDAVFWFKTDIDPSLIEFTSPQVSLNNQPGKDMENLFVGEVVKNSDGSYAKNEDGAYLFRVGLNLDIPYRIIANLNKELNESERSELDENHKYTKKDISFFHIVAGSLQKRIEIKDLNLDPYLNVSPQTIIIDTRELYTSGDDNKNISIFFETNVDPGEENVIFTLSDPDGLVKGKGDGVLKITKPSAYETVASNVYNIIHKENIETAGREITLNIRDIIAGNPFWNENNEFTLTFTLTGPWSTEPLIRNVVIKVRPFSGTYTIHFRDNTKPWEEPHIYVYQDLTLPSDMQVKDADGSLSPYDKAGKIIGFVEENPSSGLQWNAAVQYVFSNNLAFRGWHGNHIATINNGKYQSLSTDEYGGPEINNPWEEATCINSTPTAFKGEPTTTYGFVMFGNPYQRKGDAERANDDFWFWNYSYSYNKTYQLRINEDREKRYNYDINFNADHEKGLSNWSCSDCINMAPDYNAYNNEHFYPGIAMEREADGWWKYTLTGVAQPGRTMVIFANWHTPWNNGYNGRNDYSAEDNRWPGDYESGLPLFDFEDNDGWFLFDGNTTNADQKFTDDKPVDKIIPHTFTSAYKSKLKVEVKKPSTGAITGISVGGVTGSLTENNDRYYVEVTDPTFKNSDATLEVKVTVSGSEKTYNLSPKNFVRNASGGFVTATPLYWEYNQDIQLFVKWNDHVSGQGYSPGDNGSSQLTVWYGGNSSDQQLYDPASKEYGNYKYTRFYTKTPDNNDKGLVQLRLSADSNFSKNLKVEDLPQYYYPTEKNYLINVHKLP